MTPIPEGPEHKADNILSKEMARYFDDLYGFVMAAYPWGVAVGTHRYCGHLGLSRLFHNPITIIASPAASKELFTNHKSQAGLFTRTE